MRALLPLILVSTFSALAMEIVVSDKKRTELSAAVFTGTITNVQHLPLVRTNSPPDSAPGAVGFYPLGGRVQDLGVWRAEVVVESVTKQDVPLGTVAVVYYPQRPVGLDGRPTLGGRVCPGYPVIETNMHATFWCHRVTIEGLTNVLYVSMPSWVKKQMPTTGR
jgi:hypothetical protein